MIKILEKKLLEITCKKCQSKLEFEASDLAERKGEVQTHITYNISGSDRDYTQTTSKVLVCPVCSKEHVYSSDTKPYHYRF